MNAIADNHQHTSQRPGQHSARLAPGGYSDFNTRIEHKRRTRELRELAEEEHIPLPMPPEWIATLEALGFVVDLITGAWTDPAPYWPAQALCSTLGDGDAA